MKHTYMLLSLLAASLLSYYFSPSMEYEYVLSSSLLTSLSFLVYACIKSENSFLEFKSWKDAVRVNVLCLLAFLAISYTLFYGLSCQCSIRSLSFWILLNFAPMISFTTALSFLLKKSDKKLLSLTLLFSIVILDLVFHLWMQPQKRISHWLIGFIHGPIYDRLIYFDSALFFSRLFYFILGLYIPLRLLAQTRLQRAFSRCLGFVGIFVFISFYGKFSTSNLKKKLDEALPETKAYKQMLVHYKKDDKNINQLFKEAKFHYDELSASLGKPEKIIQVYIYPNQKYKKLWFGGGNTDVADVYTPSIHISSRNHISHPTLRHELVHAFSSFFAYHGLGFHPNMALTEGLAEALAPTRRSLDLDTSSGYLIAKNKVGSISDLFSPLFWKESGSRAYTIAGSLMLYLISNYDLDAVTRLYMGESLESVFPNKHKLVIAKWKDMVLAKYKDSKSDIEAESLYRSPGVLRDICPHTKALLYSKHKSFWQTIRQSSGWNYRDYWLWRLEINPNDRYAQYKVQSKRIISRLKKNENIDLIKLAQSYELPPKNTEDLELAILHFDALVELDQMTAAFELINELKKLSQQLDLSQSITRSIWARYLLKDKKNWLGYLTGLSPLPKKADSWIENYLIFRNKKDTAHLETKYYPEQALPASFTEQWYLLRASYYFKRKNYSLAAEQYLEAIAASREGDRSYLKLRVRLMRYLAND